MEQIEKAVAALKQLEKKPEDVLIPEDPYVSLEFVLWDNFNSNSPFPEIVPVRHQIYEDSDLPVVVFTKDPQEEWKTTLANAFPPFPVKVISVEKMRRKYGYSNDRRKLIKNSRVFVADRRLGRILPDILKKDFFAGKHVPALIDLSCDEILPQIEAVLESSLVSLPKGTKFGARIGRLSWNNGSLAENAFDVMEYMIKKIGEEKIAMISLRAPGSVLLPVYTAKL